MFLICLPPSMRETVGAGTHGTAAAMVKAADALWHAQGGHNPTVTAASTQRSRSPTPSSGKRGDKRGGNAPPKSRPLPAQIFILFRTLAMACVNFTTTTPIGLTGEFRPVLGQKTNSPPDPFRFGGFFHTCHCHGYAFSCKHWLDVLTNELTNDRYLVDIGATLSIVPCNQNSSPSGPLLKGADGQPIPSWGFIQKTVQFQGKLLTSTFLQAAVAGPVLGIDFLRKLKVIVSPEISWCISHIYVNLVGPLQYSNSFIYIFTIIDRMSKWMEAIPLSETSAAACTKTLTFTWISHFGVPETITSDRGPQFTSNLWFTFAKCLAFHTNKQ